MTDIIDEMEHAVSLHVRGRSDEALEVGSRLLPRARGSAHAATVYRHIAEFLHAVGNYDRARQMAEESGSLARALRNPSEILASTLVALACDLYDGDVAITHRQLQDLMELAGDQPGPLAFMTQLMLLVGNFDQAADLAERTRAFLERPHREIHLAQVLLAAGKAHLLSGRLEEARLVLERALAFEVPTLVPGTLAQAVLGLVLVMTGEEEDGLERVDRSVDLGRKISRDVQGHALAMGGLARAHLEDPGIATEQLRSAVGLLTHPIERQESFCALGKIALRLGDKKEAVAALQRATEPTTDTHFGRLAVRSLRDLVGLRLV
jgi:tetratricopeptide (TPR) repeat protein